MVATSLCGALNKALKGLCSPEASLSPLEPPKPATCVDVLAPDKVVDDVDDGSLTGDAQLPRPRGAQ